MRYKNNFNINLNDGNHFRIVWYFGGDAVKHTMFRIYIKNFVTNCCQNFNQIRIENKVGKKLP